MCFELGWVLRRNLLLMLCKGGWSYSSQSPQQTPVPCLTVIHSGMLKMSCWLPDCALGTGRSWRAQNTSHWCNVPLLPHGTCLISTGLVCGMHKCIPFRVSCGIDTNTYKDLHTWPLLPHVCQLSPKFLCIPLKALCSCITLPAAIVPRLPLWLKRSRL